MAGPSTGVVSLTLFYLLGTINDKHETDMVEIILDMYAKHDWNSQTSKMLKSFGTFPSS